jgi:hypothetical protein
MHVCTMDTGGMTGTILARQGQSLAPCGLLGNVWSPRKHVVSLLANLAESFADREPSSEVSQTREQNHYA